MASEILSSGSPNLNDGPPPPSSKPKKAPPSQSALQSAGQGLMNQSQNGMGAEGGSTEMLAIQGLAYMQKGAQILSAVFPGVTPLISDLLGRLNQIVPTMAASMGQGGSGLIPMNGMPQPMPPPPMPGMPPAGAPPMGSPSGPAPMGPPAAPPMAPM